MQPMPSVLSDEEFRLFNDYLTERFGLHFPDHKREIFEAKLGRVLEGNGCRTFMDLYYHLSFNEDNRESQQELIGGITNNESYFFRETHQFQDFIDYFSSGGFVGSHASAKLKIFSAGCSTGAEPYTLNIFLRERGEALQGLSYTIDAMDLDREELLTAAGATYQASTLRGLDDHQVDSYFERVEQMFVLKKQFRENISFFEGNIMEPESYTGKGPYNVLFCRNVLIYFSESAIHRAVEYFSQILVPGGLLFLGHAESIIGVSVKFEVVRIGNCIAYRKK